MGVLINTPTNTLNDNKKTPKSLTRIAFTLVGLLSAIPMMATTAYADSLSDLIALKLKTQSNPHTTRTNHSINTPTTTHYPVYNAPPVASIFSPANQRFYQNYAVAPNIETEHIDTLYSAEQQASMPAKQVLQTVRQMTLDNREIIKGSCWDYLNAAFSRAGVSRDTVFKGEYPYGPFANTNEIRPGDWLYYVNHSYNDVEHSGLFVGWLNREANQALILSYAGENRREPARYKVYDVSHTYNIMRPSY